MKNKKTTPSILTNKAEVPAINSLSKEGVDYINVSKCSVTELGKMLAPGYPVKLTTIFGKVGTIRGLMDFIATPGYPIDILKKEKLSPFDIKKIPHKKISIPNFWTIVALTMVERIKSDKKVFAMLKELPKNVVFTSFNEKTTGDFFGQNVGISLPNVKMGRYLSVIRHVKEMIDNDTFNDEEILNFINQTKDCPEQDVYEGLPIVVTRK